MIRFWIIGRFWRNLAFVKPGFHLSEYYVFYTNMNTIFCDNILVISKFFWVNHEICLIFET
jgi:hypothetical protein